MSDAPALPGYEFEPSWLEWEGLRLAYVDAGPSDGPVVVLQHGEPTWGFLWRKVLAPLHAAGLRTITLDLPGFGRSDKPTDLGWYSYDRHTAALQALVDHVDPRDATMVVHDWGGPIGMRVWAGEPERFGRLVVLDTGFFTGEQTMSDAWFKFRDFVARTEDLPVGFLVRGGCAKDPGDEVIAAYDWPYADGPQTKAGTRAFPLMMPLAPDDPGAAEGRAARDATIADGRPKLVLWADGDPIIPLKAGEKLAERLGAPPPTVIEGASHFLQEDAGEVIGEHIARFVAGAPA